MREAIQLEGAGEVSLGQGSNVVDLPHLAVVLPSPRMWQHRLDVGHEEPGRTPHVPPEMAERTHPLRQLCAAEAGPLVILKPRGHVLPVVLADQARAAGLTGVLRAAGALVDRELAQMLLTSASPT